MIGYILTHRLLFQSVLLVWVSQVLTDTKNRISNKIDMRIALNIRLFKRPGPGRHREQFPIRTKPKRRKAISGLVGLSKAKYEPICLAAQLRIEDDFVVIVVHIAQDIALAVEYKPGDLEFRNNDAGIDSMY